MTLVQAIPIIIGCYLGAALAGLVIGHLLCKKLREPVLIKKWRINGGSTRVLLRGGTGFQRVMREAVGRKRYGLSLGTGESPAVIRPVGLESADSEEAVNTRLELAMERLARAREKTSAAAESARLARLEAEAKARAAREITQRISI